MIHGRFRQEKDSKHNGFIYFVAINGLSGNNNVSLGRNLIVVKIKMKICSYTIAKVCVDITVYPCRGYCEIYEHLSPKNNFRIREEADIPNCDFCTLFFALFVADWFLGAP